MSQTLTPHACTHAVVFDNNYYRRSAIYPWRGGNTVRQHIYSCSGHVNHKHIATLQSNVSLAVNTTCKLLNQLEELRQLQLQLDSSDVDCVAVRGLIVVTETNMKDSCHWVGKLAYFVCAYYSNNYLTR